MTEKREPYAISSLCDCVTEKMSIFSEKLFEDVVVLHHELKGCDYYDSSILNKVSRLENDIGLMMVFSNSFRNMYDTLSAKNDEKDKESFT